jgi:hypothetical protein
MEDNEKGLKVMENLDILDIVRDRLLLGEYILHDPPTTKGEDRERTPLAKPRNIN